MPDQQPLNMNLTIKEAEDFCKQIIVKNTVLSQGRRRNRSLSGLSKLMGMNHNYLKYAFEKPPRISLLLALSSHLDMNIIHVYERFLPPTLQVTGSEILLKQEIDKLKAEIESKDKTIEMLKDLIKGK